MDLQKLFDDFFGKKILVIGDVMIDEYIKGKTNRISPEAPVPIIEMTSKENKIGGAGNVVMNLKELGADPILCSVVGEDKAADDLIQLMKLNSLDSSGIIKSMNRITSVKTRVIANKQQVVRVDHETTKHISEEEKNKVKYFCEKLINNHVDGVIFEDYDKGLLSAELIDEIIQMCRKNKIPTAVDPKRNNFLNYAHSTIFKPNLKELKEGLNLNFSDNFELSEISMAAQSLEKRLKNSITLITLSEHGIFIKKDKHQSYIKAHVRNISDVSGAGDTVIAVALLCFLAGGTVNQIAQISNIAGGLACEKPGVARISNTELKQECIRLKIQSK